MTGSYLLEISYIIASVCFIFGLKMLSHPETARQGNRVAAVGMCWQYFLQYYFIPRMENLFVTWDLLLLLFL